jgi:hypothetical protein
MKVRTKWLPIGALPICALLVGVADRPPETLIDGDSLLSTFIAVVCVLLVFLWYRLDTNERCYRRTWGLGIAMLLLTVFALPWYMIRSRPGAWGLVTLTKGIGVFILCGLVYQLSSNA